MRVAASWSAASTSPSSRATAPSFSASAAKLSAISALFIEKPPSFQVMSTALAPSKAAQVFSATTATPVEISTTSRTPVVSRAAVASKVSTEPPNTGGCTTVAKSMSGTRTSMPKVALPVTRSGVSSCGVGLPM